LRIGKSALKNSLLLWGVLKNKKQRFPLIERELSVTLVLLF
jgi:hypothetical protein